MYWSARFHEPIPLPDGGELRTLIDAGRYVAALPLGTHQREEWQAVMEVPILVTGHNRGRPICVTHDARRLRQIVRRPPG
jgi:hypothetical protein